MINCLRERCWWYAPYTESGSNLFFCPSIVPHWARQRCQRYPVYPGMTLFNLQVAWQLPAEKNSLITPYWSGTTPWKRAPNCLIGQLQTLTTKKRGSASCQRYHVGTSPIISRDVFSTDPAEKDASVFFRYLAAWLLFNKASNPLSGLRLVVVTSVTFGVVSRPTFTDTLSIFAMWEFLQCNKILEISAFRQLSKDIHIHKVHDF